MAEPLRADLSGQTCLVTGASAGIGLATAHGLARLGARVVMAVRNPEKGERARRAVMGATGRDVEMAVVDLASRKSIRAFARDFTGRHPKLDVLVNNAGIWSERRKVSPDGVELVWATNVLGYFLVTELLLPQLQAAGKARVVNVASQLAGGLDLADVQFERRAWSGRARLRAEQAGRPHADLGARAAALGDRGHGQRDAPRIRGHRDLRQGRGAHQPRRLALLEAPRARPEEGADTVVWLAASPEVENRSGLFWIDRQERRCRFRDEAGEEALWALCREMTRPA